jgi:hypothetical protein
MSEPIKKRKRTAMYVPVRVFLQTVAVSALHSRGGPTAFWTPNITLYILGVLSPSALKRQPYPTRHRNHDRSCCSLLTSVDSSCSLCRKRKVRCDRETPCSNCVNSKNANCVYDADAPCSVATRKNTPLRPREEPQHAATPFQAQFSDRQIYDAPAYQHHQQYQMVDRRIPTGLPTPGSTTSIEPESLRSRPFAEVDRFYPRTSSSVASAPSVVAPGASPAVPNSVHIITSLSGPIDVLQDSHRPGHAISRGISHKNRIFGQSHWMNGFVVFRDIIEILEPQMKSSTSILPGIHRAKNLARVIKDSRSPSWPKLPTDDLPPKSMCDRLVEQYFTTVETLYRVLHVPTFQKEYSACWAAESKPTTAFMIQLKLVLGIGAIFHDENCSMRPEITSWIYEAQTWHSNPSFKSKLGIEYLQVGILLLLAREFADVGSELVWISAGTLLREAVYIGLHKDPSRLPRIGVFGSEMRRRIWNTILELNVQFSLVSGGPCLLSLDDFNTAPPGNYNDDDLVKCDDQRANYNIPMSDEKVYTDTSFAIALREALPVRLAVIKFLNDIATSGTYEETLRIDTAIRESYKRLRETLRSFRPNNVRAHDFAIHAIEFIMNRYISSLHIPYFHPSLHEAMYAYSRKAVFDTSLKIWNVGFSKSSTDETQFARLCRCGAGFFRGFTFHASTFLTVELRAQIQEDDGVPRPDLLSIPEEAADLVLRCIEAGETGIKGYILLSVLIAQIDGIKRRLGKEDMQIVLGKAAEGAVERCVPLLERIAGQESRSEDEGEDFNFPTSPFFVGDFMTDWDLVMSDSFNFGTGEGDLSAFLS